MSSSVAIVVRFTDIDTFSASARYFFVALPIIQEMTETPAPKALSLVEAKLDAKGVDPGLASLTKVEPIDAFLTRRSPQPTHFYWAVPNRLCGMAFPIQKAQYDWLYDTCGVRLIIDLTEQRWQPGKTHVHLYVDSDCGEGECAQVDDALQTLPKDLALAHYPIRDAGIPRDMHSFDQLIRTIHACSGVVAVHCWMGLGRTGVLNAAYRIRYHGERADPAITDIKRKRMGALPCPAQWTFLRRYEAWLRNSALTGHVRNCITHKQVGDANERQRGDDETPHVRDTRNKDAKHAE